MRTGIKPAKTKPSVPPTAGDPRPDPPPDSVVCATDAGPSLRALPEMTINEVSRYLEGTAKALDDVRYILQEAMQAAHEAPARAAARHPASVALSQRLEWMRRQLETVAHMA